VNAAPSVFSLRWIKPPPGVSCDDLLATGREAGMSKYEVLYLALVGAGFLAFASAMAYATWLGSGTRD
jgi:hypothetical protein